jgi:hypothetical protein
MKTEKDWRCWEITGCGQRENCRAGQQEGDARSCWELAGELDDYRNALNVCKDCIVHVTKQGSSALTAEEVQAILLRKESDCFLAGSCSGQAAG